MKKVEYWRWRYRDPQLGCIRRTTVALTEQEAAPYPEAERIAGTLTLREIDDDLGGVSDEFRADLPDASDLISSQNEQPAA